MEHVFKKRGEMYNWIEIYTCWHPRQLRQYPGNELHYRKVYFNLTAHGNFHFLVVGSVNLALQVASGSNIAVSVVQTPLIKGMYRNNSINVRVNRISIVH